MCKITKAINFLSFTKAPLILLVITFISAVTGSESFAKDKSVDVKTDKNWSLIVGTSLVYAPEYEGSKKMKYIFVPTFMPVYKNIIFLGIQGAGIRFPIYKNKILGSMGIGKDLFRISGRRVIRGITDEERGFIFRGAITARLADNYGLTLSAIKTLSGSNSLLLEAEGNARYSISDKIRVELSIGTSWGDDRYMNFKFGITPAQSLVSGFRPYSPRAAFKLISGGIKVRYNFNKSFSITLSHTSALLLNDAVNSPTTFRQHQPLTALTAAYIF